MEMCCMAELQPRKNYLYYINIHIIVKKKNYSFFPLLDSIDNSIVLFVTPLPLRGNPLKV